MFLDDDDVAKKHEIETYIRVAERIQADALSSFIYEFSGEIPTRDDQYDVRYIGVGPSVSVGFFLNTFGGSNIFVRRDAFISVGQYYEGSEGYEDWDLAVRFCLEGKIFEIIPESLYWYRYAIDKTQCQTYILKAHPRLHDEEFNAR